MTLSSIVMLLPMLTVSVPPLISTSVESAVINCPTNGNGVGVGTGPPGDGTNRMCVSVPVTGSFWYTNIDMVQDLFTGMYRAGQYPTTVYPRWLRLVLTFLIPIGLAVTTPAQSLTGRLTWLRLLALVGFVAALAVVTRVVWKLGTRRYSGASA